MAGEEKER